MNESPGLISVSRPPSVSLSAENAGELVESSERLDQDKDDGDDQETAAGTGTGTSTPKQSHRQVKQEFTFPVEPSIIHVVKKPRTVMNHSYRDFSNVPAELSWEKSTSIEEMTFSEKVHDILSYEEEYGPFIGWMPHGRAFKVHIAKIFEEQICPKYFGHSRFSSFLRLLNNYGFKQITTGIDRNCYYHECFLRSMPHLCKYMPQPKNARRLVPDPENEPDLYKITDIFPLPGAPELKKVEPSAATVECKNSVQQQLRAQQAFAGLNNNFGLLSRPTLFGFESRSLMPHLSMGRDISPVVSLQPPSLELARVLRQQQLLSQAAALQQQHDNTTNLLGGLSSNSRRAGDLSRFGF